MLLAKLLMNLDGSWKTESFCISSSIVIKDSRPVLPGRSNLQYGKPVYSWIIVLIPGNYWMQGTPKHKFLFKPTAFAQWTPWTIPAILKQFIGLPDTMQKGKNFNVKGSFQNNKGENWRECRRDTPNLGIVSETTHDFVSLRN
jgi:hypothetical protein